MNTLSHPGDVVSPSPLARRLGRRWSGHPFRAAGVVGVAGYVGLTLLLLAFGFLVVNSPAIERWDDEVMARIAAATTSSLDTMAQWGSYLGETLVVIAIAAVSVAVMAWRKIWDGAGLLVVGLLVEVTVFLTVSRIAREREHHAHAALAGCNALTLESRRRVELGPLLDTLPKLERLTCRSPNIGFGHHRPHLELRALTLAIAGDLDYRGHTRLFTALDAGSLPGLRELTLELGPRWRGRPLPFDRLSLVPGVHATIRGPLREADIDGLMRWATSAELETLELADAQRPEVEQHAVARAHRVTGMRLLGVQGRPDRATLSLRPWHTLVLVGAPG